MRKYKRVSYEDRCHIYAMLKRDFSKAEMARELGFHPSTIAREIKRNSSFPALGCRKVYNVARASVMAREKAKKRRRHNRIQGKIAEYIQERLEMGWGPDAIAGRFRKELKEPLSHQTIYNYVNLRPELKNFLRFGTKRGTGRLAQRKARQEHFNSIHSRPKSATNRSRFGHWERDGMYGANRQQLLICQERKTLYTKLKKMEKQDAQYVHELTERMLRDEKVLSITNDNGSEFRMPELSKFPIYYCDPFRPDQRGSVENVIGCLRKFIKRTTDLDKMNTEQIEKIEELINKTPRKMFGYLTSYEVKKKVKLALAFGN